MSENKKLFRIKLIIEGCCGNSTVVSDDELEFTDRAEAIAYATMNRDPNIRKFVYEDDNGTWVTVLNNFR